MALVECAIESLGADALRTVLTMREIEEVRVTKIGRRWHCRLFIRGVLFMELATDTRKGIGWCCQHMLRWASKMGIGGRWSQRSRDHYSGKRAHAKPARVWFVKVAVSNVPTKLDSKRRTG